MSREAFISLIALAILMAYQFLPLMPTQPACQQISSTVQEEIEPTACFLKRPPAKPISQGPALGERRSPSASNHPDDVFRSLGTLSGGAEASSPPQRNITAYTGDIVLTGSQKMLIRDCYFILTGNLIVADQANLTLHNAYFYLNTSYPGEFNITVKDQATLKALDSSIFGPEEPYPEDVPWVWDNRTWFHITGQAVVNITGGESLVSLNCSGSSTTFLYGAYVEWWATVLCEGEANLTVRDDSYIESLILTVKEGQSLGLDGLDRLTGVYSFWRLSENASLLTNIGYDIYVEGGCTVWAWLIACYGTGSLSLLNSDVDLVFCCGQADVDVDDSDVYCLWCDDDVDVDISGSDIDNMWLAFGPGTTNTLDDVDGDTTYAYWDLQSDEAVGVSYDLTLINTAVSTWHFYAYGDASLLLLDCEDIYAYARDEADVDAQLCSLVACMIFTDEADLTLSNLPSGAAVSWDLATDADIRGGVEFDLTLDTCDVDGWEIIAMNKAYVEVESSDSIYTLVAADNAHVDVVDCIPVTGVVCMSKSFLNFTNSEANTIGISHTAKALIHSYVDELECDGYCRVEAVEAEISWASILCAKNVLFDSCTVDDMALFCASSNFTDCDIRGDVYSFLYSTFNASDTDIHGSIAAVYHAFVFADGCTFMNDVYVREKSYASLSSCTLSTTGMPIIEVSGDSCLEFTGSVDVNELHIEVMDASEFNFTLCSIDVDTDLYVNTYDSSEAYFASCSFTVADTARICSYDSSHISLTSCDIDCATFNATTTGQSYLYYYGLDVQATDDIFLHGKSFSTVEGHSSEFDAGDELYIISEDVAWISTTHNNFTSSGTLYMTSSSSSAISHSYCQLEANRIEGDVYEAAFLWLGASELTVDTSGYIRAYLQGSLTLISCHLHDNIYLLVDDQASLDMQHTVVDYYVTLTDQAEGYMENCTFTRSGDIGLYVHGEASLEMRNCNVSNACIYDNSYASITSSVFYRLYMGTFGDPTQHPVAEAYFTNFTFFIAYASSYAYLFNCTYGYIYAYNNACIKMVSTHRAGSGIIVYDDAVVHRYWHLAVTVFTPQRPVSPVVVEARWAVNASLAAKKSIVQVGPHQGWAQFVLYGSKINATGTYQLGDYNIVALYAPPAVMKKEFVSLTDDMGISITVDPPVLHLFPEEGENKTVVEAFGEGYAPGSKITITANDTPVAMCTVRPDGTFSVNFLMQGSPGYYVLNATGDDGSWDTAGFDLYDYTPLCLDIDVGSTHFRGEIAEFYLLITHHGMRVDATGLSAELFLPDGTTQSLSPTRVDTGLYKITFNIPTDAPTGTYTLLVDAERCEDHVDAHGSAIRSFLLSPTLTEWNAMLVAIQDDIAIIKTDIGTIKMNLTEIKAMISDVQDDIATLETEVGEIEVKLDTIKEWLQDMNATIVDIQGYVAIIKANMTTVLAKLDAINATITDIQNDVATVMTLLGEIEVKLDTIMTWLQDVNATIVSIQGYVAIIRANITTLMADVHAMNATIIDIITDRMDEYYVLLNTTLGELEAKLDIIKAWLQDMNATLIDITGQLAIIKVHTTTILAKLDILNATLIDIRGAIAVIDTTLGEFEAKLDTLLESVDAIKTMMSKWTGKTATVAGYKVMALTTSELRAFRAEGTTLKITIYASEDGRLHIFVPKALLEALGVSVETIDIIIAWSEVTYDVVDLGLSYMLVLTYGPGSYDIDVYLTGAPLWATLTGLLMLVGIGVAIAVIVILVVWRVKKRRERWPSPPLLARAGRA